MYIQTWKWVRGNHRCLWLMELVNRRSMFLAVYHQDLCGRYDNLTANIGVENKVDNDKTFPMDTGTLWWCFQLIVSILTCRQNHTYTKLWDYALNFWWMHPKTEIMGYFLVAHLRRTWTGCGQFPTLDCITMCSFCIKCKTNSNCTGCFS